MTDFTNAALTLLAWALILFIVGPMACYVWVRMGTIGYYRGKEYADADRETT